MEKQKALRIQYDKLLKQHEFFKKSHKRLIGVLDSLPNSIYLKDTALKYTFINKQSEEQLKKVHQIHENIIGKTDMEIFPVKAALAYQENDREVLQTGVHLRKEESITTPDGKRLVRLSFKQPLYSEDGKILGIVGHTIDITDLKDMEKALREARNKAEEFNQLKTQFISNMQHDLRSPASGVMQALSYLCDMEKDLGKSKVLHLALGSSQALISLLNEIVESSNKDYSNPVLNEPLKLKTIFESVYHLHASSATMKRLKFHYHLDEHIPQVVLSDKYRLERVLLNLVGNAIKFTKKGEVFFEASLVKQQGRNLLIELLVKDTGIGIPEDKRRVIFERFVRLAPSNKGQYKGIGLGLTNVREYVDDLEGEFKPIISAKDLGTTFSILIPMKASLNQDMRLPSVEASKNAIKQAPVEPASTLETKAQPTIEPSIDQKVNASETPQTVCGNLLLVEDSVPVQFIWGAPSS